MPDTAGIIICYFDT